MNLLASLHNKFTHADRIGAEPHRGVEVETWDTPPLKVQCVRYCITWYERPKRALVLPMLVVPPRHGRRGGGGGGLVRLGSCTRIGGTCATVAGCAAMAWMGVADRNLCCGLGKLHFGRGKGGLHGRMDWPKMNGA